MSFQPIHEMFREAAGRFASRPAMELDGRRITYRTIEEQSNRVANFLLRSARARGAVCGIYTESVAETVVAMLASLKAGGIFVVLNPALPKARLEVLTQMVRPDWILTTGRMLGGLYENITVGGARVICLDGEGAGGDALARAGRAAQELAGFDDLSATAGESDPDSPCYVYFTSGSTGKPKGILGRLCAIDHFIRWEIDTFGIGQGARVSQLTTPSFDAFLRDIFVPLCAGGTSVQPEKATLLDGRKLADWLDIEEIELVHCVPSLFRTLLATDLNAQYFASLRHVLMSGEPILPSDVERWSRIFGDRIQMVNLYGPSETTMTKLVYFVKPEDRERRSVPIGKPIPGARAVLLDRGGKIAPPQAIGEIYIRTPYRSLGYFEDPRQTALAFVQNPLGQDPGDVVYRTGDLGRLLDDGNFEFLGRADHQVKIRGQRIELLEIEDLLRRHPAVDDVAVVDRDDAAGTKYLCAYVVAREPVAASALKQFLLQELPEAMVPAAFAFLKKLPRTIAGKVDRQALPLPSAADGDGQPYVAPRTPTEQALAEIWTSLLGVLRVSADRSFFELGGHSLLATQLLSRIRTVFGVELPLRSLFDAPTLERVAASIDQARNGAARSGVPPLVRIPRGRPLPLSFSQERIWLMDQLQPGNPAYNIPQVVSFRGPFDIDRFRRSIEALVERHEPMRTSFPAVDGRPAQVVHGRLPIEIPVTDLSGLPEAQREEALSPLLREEVRAPFDLAAGPVFRARLYRLQPDLHVLVLTIHHIASDEWSRMIMTRDWAALYTSLPGGEEPALPALPIQLADFAGWQRRWMSGRWMDEELEYWKQRLGGSGVLDLPTDRPRPPATTGAEAALEGGRRNRWMPARLAEDLHELCRQEGATLFMAVMAAYQMLLSRFARQEQVSVGTPVAGRNRAEIENLLGFFINTLVIRTDFSGNPSFREALRRVRALTLEAFDHQETPFEKVVEALQPERSRGHAPLFQAVFALQNVPFQAPRIGGLKLDVRSIDTDAAKADLDLDVKDTGDGLLASLAFAASLFDAATIQRLLQHLETILTEGCADPDRYSSEIPLVTAGELHQLACEWNDTQAALEDFLPLHLFFEARAAAAPDDVAVTLAGETLTYGELDRRANRLARHLRSLGVGPDVIVGLCTDRSFDLVTGMLGILKAGGAFLALDPAFPTERLSFILRDSEVTVLVSRQALADVLPVHWGFTVHLDRDAGAIARQDDRPLAERPAPDNAAYVIYTSGSTGQPKGVVVPHRGLQNLVAEKARAYGLGPADRVLQFSSVSFDASISEIVLALWAGATLCMGSREDMMPGYPLLAFLEQERITAAILPPSALAVTPAAALPSLAMVAVAGEACTRGIVETWGPGRRFRNLYGPTEATIWASLEPCLPGETGDPTIGRPIGNVRLYVVDHLLSLVPVGFPGELLIGGIGVTRGYLGQPDRTAEKFMPDAWGGETGGRLYRTGDLVQLRPDGRIQFLGRIDHQVKVRGFRIETQEIELALARHPAVAEAVVVARAEGSDRQLVAYVALFEGSRLPAAEMHDHLAERLPEYMIPSLFVVLETLPHLPSGKVDRAALPEPERAHLGLRTSLRPPSTPVEQILAEIWREVLGFEEIGLDDSFFDLGGYSLAATQVLSRVREAFQLDYPLGQLFSAPSLGQLAEGVERALGSARVAGPPLVPLPRDRDIFELSPVQQQRWMQYQRSPEESLDHVASAFRLRGDLSPDALRAALDEVVRRHEALRTSFPWRGEERVQHIHPPGPMELQIEDLRPLAESLREEVCTVRLQETVQQAFDLEQGPLLRALLLRMGEGDHVLLLVCHHMAFDQWSAGVFLRELAQLYDAIADGRPSPLAELSLQYADYAEWQRKALTRELLAGTFDYWQSQLSGASPLALPTPGIPVPDSGPREVEVFAVSPAASEAVRRLGREQRATVFMIFLAAFKVLLAEVTGQRDLVVRAPIANRTRPEIEPLIGFFPNELLLRTVLPEDASYLDILDRVRDTTIGAYLHQSVPLETVAESLPTEDLDLEALKRVTFNYLNAPMTALELRGLHLTPLDLGAGAMRPHLMFLLVDGAGGFEGSFHYRTDVFDPPFIRGLAARFLELVEEIASDPAHRRAELGGSPSPTCGGGWVEWTHSGAVPTPFTVNSQEA